MLPGVIDYLLSLRRAGGGWLVRQGGLQVVIPFFPPNQSLAYTVRPLANVYAQLGWATWFGSEMIANAFTGTFTQWGSRPFTGTITQRMVDKPVSYLIMVTEAEPTLLNITNNSPLFQYCEILGDFLMISSREDYELVLAAIDRIHAGVGGGV